MCGVSPLHVALTADASSTTCIGRAGDYVPRPYLEVIACLIGAKADVNLCNGSFGSTPLHTTIQCAVTASSNTSLKLNLSAIELLLEAAADINSEGASVGSDGRPYMTPLMLAAASDCKAVARLLLDHGALQLTTTQQWIIGPSRPSPEMQDLFQLYRCGFCGKEGKGKRCSKCMRVAYCSLECQRQDWKGHRVTCMSA